MAAEEGMKIVLEAAQRGVEEAGSSIALQLLENGLLPKDFIGKPFADLVTPTLLLIFSDHIPEAARTRVVAVATAALTRRVGNQGENLIERFKLLDWSRVTDLLNGPDAKTAVMDTPNTPE